MGPIIPPSPDCPEQLDSLNKKPLGINRTIKLHIELVNAMRFAASHRFGLAIAIGLDRKHELSLQEPAHPFVVASEVGDLPTVDAIVEDHDSQERGDRHRGPRGNLNLAFHFGRR